VERVTRASDRSFFSAPGTETDTVNVSERSERSRPTGKVARKDGEGDGRDDDDGTVRGDATGVETGGDGGGGSSLESSSLPRANISSKLSDVTDNTGANSDTSDNDDNEDEEAKDEEDEEDEEDDEEDDDDEDALGEEEFQPRLHIQDTMRKSRQ